MKPVGQKEVFLLVTLVFGICIIYSSISPQVPSTYPMRSKNESLSDSSVSNKPCKITFMDPWAPAVQKYYQKLAPLECMRNQYDLTRLLENGTLLIDPLEKEKLGHEITCKYRCYDKIMGEDVSLYYAEWISFTDRVATNCEFIEVSCKKNTIFSKSVYSTNHNRIIPKVDKKIEMDKYSVILFVMDSVSHSHWRRSLPKSYKVFKEKYSSIIFNGMTKVGDNSFPNAVAMLAGVKSSTEFGDITGYYDDHPLIWTDFRKRGYATYYAEDYPSFNLFYYTAKGFKGKPVDHYFRPFWLNVYGSYLHRKSTNLCYGNEPMHRFQLNYFEQFIQKYRGSSFFALNWLTELGHDYMNQVQWGDEDVSELFDKNHEALKETFLFVLSDHGHRFDAIRETLIGRKEEQLPYFSVHVPESLRRKYPKLVETMENNAEKVTSFWDVYVTLKDILHLSETGNWHQVEEATLSLEIEKRVRTYSRRGMSLLRPIPARSCQEAEIPDEYCTCKNDIPVDVNSSEVISASEHLLAEVNEQVAAFEQCVPLTLSRVLDAYKEEESGDHLRIILEAKPSGALFEGLLRRTTSHFQVVGEVSRVNRYGNQSLCVDDPTLRKFCLCRSLT